MPSRNWYIRQQQIAANRLAAAFVPKVYAALWKQMQAAATAIRTHGIVAAQGNIHGDKLGGDMGAVISSLYAEAAWQALKRFKPTINARSNQKAAFGDATDFVNGVLSYFKRFLLNKVVLPIQKTTEKFVNGILDEALKEGWGVDETVKRLENTELAQERARKIVRTESVRAMNYTQLLAADEGDFEYDKEWIAIHDDRTRKTHSNHGGVDGEIRGLDEPFSNGLQFPGDPEGSAKETIQCFPGDQLTSSSGFKKAFRNRYVGKLVTVQTSSGKQFSCTPNHQILTVRGWVNAGLLNNTDKLVSSKSINDLAPVDFNINNTPTRLDEVFSSLSQSSNVIRVGGSIMDFNGDTPASNIDIINTESKLMGSGNTKLSEVFNKLFFKLSFFRFCFLFSNSGFLQRPDKKGGRLISNRLISFYRKLLSFFNSGVRHSQIHRFASISALYTSGFEPVRYDVAAASEHGRQLFNADTVIEHLNNFNGINNSFDGVVICSTHNYDGLVYTFETTTQMYDINGYVAHNCRCTMGYIARRDANGRLIRKQPHALPLASRLTMNGSVT